uniref:C-type lectin domain-containing protein n=1 Tax=Rhabditophanes sp. KR3021 TaxID=114890 RepID=A0AC35UBM5_9BILA
MLFFATLCLFYFGKGVISIRCPHHDRFFLALNNKCYKLYPALDGLSNITEDCSLHKGTLSSFINEYEVFALNNIYTNQYTHNFTEHFVDRGFTCFDSTDCRMNGATMEKVRNSITYLTTVFPCRGVMHLNTNLFHCVDIIMKHDLLFACQLEGPYYQECPNKLYKRQMDGNCYRVYEDTGFKFDTAKAICLDDKSNLATVKNHLEGFVVGQLTQGIVNEAWLDVKCKSSDLKSCVHPHSCPLTFSQFRNHTPLSDGECGVISVNGDWKTAHCGTLKRVICQDREQ